MSLGFEEAVISLPGDLIIVACVNLVEVTGLGGTAVVIAVPDASVGCRAPGGVSPCEVFSKVGGDTSEDVFATGVRSVINP